MKETTLDILEFIGEVAVGCLDLIRSGVSLTLFVAAFSLAALACLICVVVLGVGCILAGVAVVPAWMIAPGNFIEVWESRKRSVCKG